MTRPTTLVARAAGGEEAAFARIVAARHDDMTRVCYVIAGDFDRNRVGFPTARLTRIGSATYLPSSAGHPGGPP